ncbi:protein of unknown function [Thalassovita litoralis]|jgi:hypothetical protein|uniref:DnaJ homologue subfamily C member 28 conserved domain-containing protein n=2 Tax=Thalassovita litoralis TaxID=1010611 RepID=A0A521FP84_9RHOB|nr:protein of unknown function [Thalassovita litoralis]
MSMDHPLIDLINQKIAQAESEGAFDNLSGAGRPLPACDDPENALFNRLIRENGAVPEFVALSRELAALRAELRDCSDRTRRGDLLRDMSMMETRIEVAKQAFKKG